MQHQWNNTQAGGPAPTKLSARLSLRIFWIVIGTIVVIFSGYEVVERLWLVDVDMRLLHVLHIIRGIATCVIAAILVAWYILRVGPSIFPAESLDTGASLKFAASDQSQREHFNYWFIRMRWLACIMAAVLTAVMVKVLKYLDEATFVPLIVLILCIAVSNIVYTLLLRKDRFVKRLPELQIGIDLMILTAMLHFSGGIENPIFLAYVFHIIIAGILLSRRKCYAIITFACILFSALAFAEMSGTIPHYTLLVFPHVDETEQDRTSESDGAIEAQHEAEEAQHLIHAAHNGVYVTSVVVFQFIVLALTGYFTVTIMDRSRADHGRLQTIRLRLERVLEATGVGFAIVDSSLRPVWLNEQIRDWLALSDEVEGKKSDRLDAWMGGEQGATARTFRDGLVRNESRQLTNSDGNKRFFDTTIAPLVNSAGEVFEVVELTQDVTEKKILESQAVQAGKMAALGTVAAGVAHEVGNPLASISTRLRLLEKHHDKSFLEESVKMLQSQIERIGRIVREISQFARPAKTQWSICRINVLVSETLTLLRFHRGAETTRIEGDLSGTIPDIMCEQDELIQVFLNLGLNAIEAMEHDGTLTVRTYAQDDEIHIEFSDTGPGLDDGIQSRLFDPFFTSKEGGSGLGLSIAHRIVTSYGGWIEATNRKGGGAQFTVVLPVRKPA